MATKIWFDISSGKGLLLGGIKPLPEPMLTGHQSSNIHIRAISQEMPQPSITKIILRITYLKLYSNFPGVNELNGGYFLSASTCKVPSQP